MTKTGYVSKIEDNKTYVITECESACGHDCSTCSSHCKKNFRESLVINTVGAKVGDRVEMSVSDSKVVFLAFLVYMLPLIILFGIWIVSDYIWDSGLLSFVSVAVFLIIWAFFVVKYNKKGVINKIERIL